VLKTQKKEQKKNSVAAQNQTLPTVQAKIEKRKKRKKALT